MILAELHGKLTSKIEEREDILTSNVFSFFKYSDRHLLMEYLCLLGINVSLEDARKAEFNFWISYDDGTEPDLVIVCGKYYILFEAKFHSDFSPGTSTTDHQIKREIRLGKLDAENLNKIFVYVAITAEYYKSRKKYLEYEGDGFIWTHWQKITSFIEDKINSEFAKDLHDLLLRKNLRRYNGLCQDSIHYNFDHIETVFYDIKSAKYYSVFSGFADVLSKFYLIPQYKRFYYKTFFNSLVPFEISSQDQIFYENKS